MISLDADYIALKPYLEAECKRRKLDFQFTELNPAGWGDMMFISELTGIHLRRRNDERKDNRTTMAHQ